MSAVKKNLRCPRATSNTVSRAELGMHPLNTNRDMRKLKWQYEVLVRNIPKKRLPAIVDRAVWEKVTKSASWNKAG